MVMKMNRRWIINNVNIEENIPGINPLIQKILYKRGIRKKNEIKRFLKGDLADLHDPFLFRDMKSAVRRITEAISNREKVIIYGDYDVDGITSTALLYNYFRDNYGFEVDYYLPSRLKEGYGLNLAAVKKLSLDYDLLITVDCGITAVKEVNAARKDGLDVIITDHHKPGEDIPQALAILNPHLAEDSYPCKYLAGVGVAFKLCQALNKNWENYLDLVTLGTIADIVPLKDENRIIVRKGLRELVETDNRGLKILLEKLGLYGKKITVGQVGFIIAPPLNAAGRIENPEKAIKLLTSDIKEEIEPLAKELTQINRLRQQKEEEILKQAEEMIAEEVDLDNKKGIVLASEDWHPGIIGIVASRLVEKYYLPVVLIALEGGEGRGSCRSIEKIDIYEVLTHCARLLTEFGGHSQAAGLTISREKIADFRKRFNDYLARNYTPEDFVSIIKIDCVLDENNINMDLYDNIKELMPFGIGNPRPKFLISSTGFKRCYTVGKEDRHLKFELENGISGIGFDMGYLQQDLNNKKADLAFTVKLNKWQGKENIELNLIDINLHAREDNLAVCYSSEKIYIYDKRFCGSSEPYLSRLKNNGNKIAVYIYNKKICKKLKDYFSGYEFYFFTGLNSLPQVNIDELVLISLPFSVNQLAKMLKLFSDNKVKLHLLYGHKEYYTGQKLIKNHLHKLDLSETIRYNENTDVIEKFNEFSRIAYAKKLFELLKIVKNNLQEEDNESKVLYKKH